MQQSAIKSMEIRGKDLRNLQRMKKKQEDSWRINGGTRKKICD